MQDLVAPSHADIALARSQGCTQHDIVEDNLDLSAKGAFEEHGKHKMAKAHVNVSAPLKNMAGKLKTATLHVKAPSKKTTGKPKIANLPPYTQIQNSIRLSVVSGSALEAQQHNCTNMSMDSSQ